MMKFEFITLYSITSGGGQIDFLLFVHKLIHASHGWSYRLQIISPFLLRTIQHFRFTNELRTLEKQNIRPYVIIKEQNTIQHGSSLSREKYLNIFAPNLMYFCFMFQHQTHIFHAHNPVVESHLYSG